MKLLRTALRLDSVVTTGNGLAYLAFAGPLHELLGPSAGLLRALGILLILYGAAVMLVSLPAAISRAATWTVVAVNGLWTVASIAELLAGGLDTTTAGSVWVVLQALTVGGFAGLQFLGLRSAAEPGLAASSTR
ncbi:hypothetical protein [Longispora albida]|uniref:hypothetical protein n=1 Tax=Longispora albida TaxID=203523 RepID=UPI00037284E3|nr:hypothetical protein [Longispora albida]